MIYLSPPSVSELERQLLLEAFDSNWITPLGPFVERFEAAVAKVAGRQHAVALSSGTAALHLALLLAGVQPGDEVLVPTLTFAATANAVVYCGATPVFVDSEPETWNIDPSLVEEELAAARASGRRIGAVIPVDLYGQCADYGRLTEICRNYEVPLIADAAEAVGASYRGRPAGSFGELAAFSFNGNKIVTTGGGGALLTDDAEVAERARYLASQARLPAEHYEHSEIGFNYRLSNLLAAVGCGQLERLPFILGRRRRNSENYRISLSDADGVRFAPRGREGEPNHWLTVILVTDELGEPVVLHLIEALRRSGFEARRAWKPMHVQPAFAGRRRVGGTVAESIFEKGVCLPSGTDLRDEEIAAVVKTVRTALAAVQGPVGAVPSDE